MRQLLSLTLVIVVYLTSCTVAKPIPLKGNYQAPPFQITSEKNFEQVWEKLIDLFAQSGLPIKLIDKSSGIIISERSLLSTSIEDKEGKLIDNKAFIAVPKVYNKQTGKYAPISYHISGEWNVRVKKSGEQSTINVNIVNVRYDYYDPFIKAKRETVMSDYKSTGELERLISKAIM